MKYSYTWLKELSGTKKSPKELAELLTMRAFEVEDAKTEGKETQLEISILPNRGHDALSHIGIAREICACEGRKFILRSNLRMLLRSNLRKRLEVEIKDKKLCLRYMGAVLENIKVGPSPKWMQEKLLVCGVKPINNVVDVTNYIMLETGQPLHAFDADKTTGNIIVRRAKKGEKIKLLDEKTYELNENNLVIADSEKALALAGVMGGLGSSINKNTASIILESANFNSTSIRKTRTAHNVITESSYRFERDIDPNLAETAAARAIELLEEYGGKNVKTAAISDVYPKKVKPWRIKLDTNYVNKLLGENIPVAKMKNILENLGMKMLGNRVSKLNVEVPTRRIDLKTPEDLIEEIGRIYGYENIQEQALVAEVKTPPQNAKRDFENKLRDILTGLGFSEVMNYSFYGADDIAKCNLGAEDHIEIANPLSLDQQYLRRALIPNLLRNVELNSKHFNEIQIFEIGKKFRKNNESMAEISILNGLLANDSKNPFFELKGKLEALLDNLGHGNTKYETIDPKYKVWHPARVARILIEGKKIGKIGEISPLVAKKYGIKKRVACFGLQIDKLLELEIKEKIYHAIAKFPIVERDISMFVGKDTKYADIASKIEKSGGNLVKEINLFDIFEKEGEKSLALRLKIGSDAKTLTSEKIDAVMKKIISTLEKDLKVKVRK
ncbi:MAG: phenylalanine--tRNA ligase subunit beta [Patescibacteria group bacterium]|nr:phenylalanine--tRNA ligase subunit beta [Patescibacteria group bacterium]